MNRHICKDCADGIGYSMRYLVKLIEEFKTTDKGITDKTQEEIKQKLKSFFNVDPAVLSIEKRMEEIEKRVEEMEENLVES